MTLQRILNFFLIFLMLISFFVGYGVADADVLGQQVSFNVNPKFDKFKRASLQATLRYAGDRAYFYVDDGYWNKLDLSHQNSFLSNLAKLSDKFDDVIYPKETSFWGSEPNPGVDGDPKLTILVEELLDNNGGYFDTANAYTKNQVPDSNQREMIAVSAHVLGEDVGISEMFLAHEFQHMISFNQKEKKYNLAEDVWLNELRSEYSISVAGLNDTYEDSNLDHRTGIFLNNQSDSLTEWPNKNSDYAVAALFAEYLSEQFGPEILSKTLAGPLNGIASLNQYFKDNGYTEKFDDVFVNWLGALYVNDISVRPNLGYKRAELRNFNVSPQQRILLSDDFNEYSFVTYLKDFQPFWAEFNFYGSGDEAKSIKIELSGDLGQNYAAAYMAYYDSGRKELGRVKILSGKGSVYIINSSDRLSRIVVAATKTTKSSGFTDNEAVSGLNVKISTIDTAQAKSMSLVDGALIKRPREKEIYVIWGKYKRYLNPDVIKLYGHLNPVDAIELQPEVFDSYQTSNYVKYVNDEKVYAIWPDGTKHWMNITARQWDDSRRDWNAIFTINDLELNHYRIGSNITR